MVGIRPEPRVEARPGVEQSLVLDSLKSRIRTKVCLSGEEDLQGVPEEAEAAPCWGTSVILGLGGPGTSSRGIQLVDLLWVCHEILNTKEMRRTGVERRNRTSWGEESVRLKPTLLSSHQEGWFVRRQKLKEAPPLCSSQNVP